MESRANESQSRSSGPRDDRWPAALLFALCAACTGGAAERSEGAVEDEGPGGSEDSNSVVVSERNEALRRPELKQELCAAIAADGAPTQPGDRESLVRRCQMEFTFTLTRMVTSRLYAYKDSHHRPLPLAMDVTVTDGAQAWPRRLLRVLGEGWRLEWVDSARAGSVRPNAAIEDPLAVAAVDASGSAVPPDARDVLCSWIARQASDGMLPADCASYTFAARRKIVSKLYSSVADPSTGLDFGLEVDAIAGGTTESMMLVRTVGSSFRLAWSDGTLSSADFIADLVGALERGYSLEEDSLRNHLRRTALEALSEEARANIAAEQDEIALEEGVRVSAGTPFQIVQSGALIGWVIPMPIPELEATAYLLLDTEGRKVALATYVP